MDADGRNDHRISAGLGFTFSWSPTGSRLVVDGDGGIYVVERDGGRMQRIAAEASGATWAPDETRIAFAHWEEGLRVVGSDGTGEKVLTKPRGVASDGTPAWSPDGKLIAFERSDDPSNHLGVVSPSGTNLRFLKTCFNICGQPVWSPNGRKIAFSDNADIWIINADGTALTNLTDSQSQLEDHPTWSPSGRYLAFESRNRNTVRSLEVHTIRIDGTHRRNVSRSPRQDSSPDWSPDGRTIAFSSIRDGNIDVWVVTATGKAPRNLTNEQQGSQNWLPQWSP
jgi:TolB protein